MHQRILLSSITASAVSALHSMFGRRQPSYKDFEHTYKGGKGTAFTRGSKSKSLKTRSNRAKAKAKK